MGMEENRLRTIIQEEIAREKNTRFSTTAMYRNAQAQINDTASTVVADFSAQQQHKPPNATQIATTAKAISVNAFRTTSYASRPARGRGKYKQRQGRHSPGHPYRLPSSSPACAAEKPLKSVNVWLVDAARELNNNYAEEDEESNSFSEIVFSEEMVIMKGYVSLNPLETEEQPIREVLCSLFQKKLQNITTNDFFFIKRERNKLVLPQTEDNYIWNYCNIKLLIGQGKLYCCLQKPYVEFVRRSSEGNNSVGDTSCGTSTQSHSRQTCVGFASASEKKEVFEVDDSELPSALNSNDQSSSKGDSTMANELENCKSLIHDLLDSSPAKKFESLTEILKFLNKKIKAETEKLTVDPEDILSDALVYFKSSTFDAAVKLQVRYRKQAAVDTGGVLRQFYTDCWLQLLDGSDIMPALFEGADRCKLPSFNAGIVMSGVIKYIGKLFAHAICQAGMGFNYLAPAIYWYLATGDSTEANKYTSIDDVTNLQVQKYLKKILDIDVDKSELNSDNEFVDLLSERGFSHLLGEDNRDAIWQALIFHEVIGKRTAALNQIRDGLKELGVLDVIEKNPELCLPLFVYKDGIITADNVRSILKFDESVSNNIEKNFLNYFSTMKNCDVESFLQFVTGAAIIPPRRIVVNVVEGDGIFASTCLRELSLPKAAEDYATLVSLMKSAINTDDSKSFTVV